MPNADGSQSFSKNDWIVHSIYGVGQVRGVESKSIAGTERDYYKVKGMECTFWIPVNSSDESSVRPMVTRTELEKALMTLSNEPNEMASKHTKRWRTIKEAMAEGTLISTCRIIRDLWARNKKKKLSASEQEMFRKLKDALFKEWMVCAGLNPNEVSRHFKRILQGESVSAIYPQQQSG
jgi:RNA polymerase-interacting CarD/CdnL/TRCF family regulator